MKPTPFDTALIEALKPNARVSNREIGRRLGVPENKVRSRLKDLQEQQAIRVGVVIDPLAVGLNCAASVFVSVAFRHLREVAQTLASRSTVTFVALVAGEFNVAFVYVGPSEADLWQLLNNELAGQFPIDRLEVRLITAAPKHRYDLIRFAG